MVGVLCEEGVFVRWRGFYVGLCFVVVVGFEAAGGFLFDKLMEIRYIIS